MTDQTTRGRGHRRRIGGGLSAAAVAMALATLVALIPPTVAQAEDEHPRPANLPASSVRVPFTIKEVRQQRDWVRPQDGLTARTCYAAIFLVVDGDSFGEPVPNFPGWVKLFQEHLRNRGNNEFYDLSQAIGRRTYDPNNPNLYENPPVRPWAAWDVVDFGGSHGISFWESTGTTWPEYGCQWGGEGYMAQEAAWAAREVIWSSGTKPTVSCSVTSQTGPGGSVISFNSVATAATGGGISSSWEFSDGTTSTATNVVKTATKPGTYSGTVIGRDGSNEARATCTAEVTAPELGASIRVLDPPEGETGSRLSLGQEFEVALRVSASSGLGPLTDVKSVGDFFEIEGGVEIIEEPEPPAEPLAIEPDRDVEYTWKLKAIGAGDFHLRSKWTGTDAAGRVVEQADAYFGGQVNGLAVDLVQKPAELVFGADNDDDGDVDDDDAKLTVEVTVTNLTEDDITGIKASDAAEPLKLTSRMEGLEVSLISMDVPPPIDFGTLEAGASKTVTYRYLAFDRVSADATIVVRGVQGGEEVASVGRGRVTVGKDLWVKSQFAVEERPYRAGQTVRLTGQLENVTKVVDGEGTVVEEGFPIGVIVEPKVAGNAGGGHLFPASSGGRTPTTPLTFFLDPEEKIDLGAILATVETAENTAAEVTYTVHVWKHEAGEEIEKGEETQVEMKEVDGFSASHRVPLAPVATTKDPFLTCGAELPWASYLSCRFTSGFAKFAVGTWDLAKITAYGATQYVRANIGILSTIAWAEQQLVRALLGDPAALDRLAAEILIDLQALKAVGVESLQGVSLTASSLVPMLANSLREIDKMIEDRDVRGLAGGLAEFGGENIDIAGGVLNLVRKRAAARTIAGVAGAEGASKQALEKSFQEQADSLGRRVNDAAAQGKDVTRGVLKNGDDVTTLPQVWAKAYGARAQDIANLLKIARDEGVILAFRSRAPRAADLLEAGLAWAKPGGVSIKTVSDLDRRFLGYLDEWDAKAVLVEPPVKWVPAGAERDALVEAYLDRFPQLTSPSDFSKDLRAAVKSRLETRMDEWPSQLQKFSEYASKGIDVNFHAQKQDLPDGLIPNNQKLRKARVTPGELAANGLHGRRQVFFLEMADASGSNFREIVGDIDFLGIFNPDGSVITDVAKRVRIYNLMRSLVSMQHGESFTFSGKASLREEFLRCCTEGEETMLAAMQDGRLRATSFRDNLSAGEAGPNAGLLPEGQDFTFLSGLTSEAQSAVRPAGTLVLPSLLEYLTQEAGGKVIPHSPKDIAKALADLEKQIRETKEFDRKKGNALRPTGDGGLEKYTPPPGSGSDALVRWDAALRPEAVVPVSADRSPEQLVADDIAGIIDDLRTDGYDGPVPGVGALGGRWDPIAVDDALAGSDRLATLPTTYLGTPAGPGDSVLDVMSPDDFGMDPGSAFFRAGDEIVIDPGGATEELAIVAGYADGTITLVEPLTRVHDIATMVVLPVRDVDAGPPGPVDPEPPLPNPSTPPTPTTPTTPGILPTMTARPDAAPAAPARSASTPAARGDLARTGADLSALALLALALLGAGTTMVAANRRRRRAGT